MPLNNIDPLLFRFVEKIVALLVGGMSIYLGYRLFSSASGQSDGKGSFKLPLNRHGCLNLGMAAASKGPGITVKRATEPARLGEFDSARYSSLPQGAPERPVAS